MRTGPRTACLDGQVSDARVSNASVEPPENAGKNVDRVKRTGVFGLAGIKAAKHKTFKATTRPAQGGARNWPSRNRGREVPKNQSEASPHETRTPCRPDYANSVATGRSSRARTCTWGAPTYPWIPKQCGLLMHVISAISVNAGAKSSSASQMGAPLPFTIRRFADHKHDASAERRQ